MVNFKTADLWSYNLSQNDTICVLEPRFTSKQFKLTIGNDNRGYKHVFQKHYQELKQSLRDDNLELLDFMQDLVTRGQLHRAGKQPKPS